MRKDFGGLTTPIYTTRKTNAKVRKLNGFTMFTILFSFFILILGVTVGLTYSGFQSTAESNGTITFNTPIYTITLDNANATTNGTSTIYEKYVIGTFTNSQCTTQMTTSTNPITKPARAYTISYNSNGGSSCSNQTATYTFNGYYTASTGGVQMISSNGYITNNFTPTYFSSNTTFHAQWSSASIILPTPTYTGYTFGGWYGEAGLTNKIGDGGDSYTPTANKTLYAKWTIKSYTVTYDVATNGGTSGATTASVNYGSTADLTKSASKSGWNFIGWNTNSSATTGLSSYTITGNTTLYAIFSKTLTINYNNNGATGSVSAVIYNTAVSGTSSTNLPAVAGKSGWSVYGWSNSTAANSTRVDGTTTAHAIIITTSNTGSTYYATYSRTLTLSYNANGGNSTPSSQTTTQYYNSAGNTSSHSFTLASAISRNADVYTYSFNSWGWGSANGTSYNAGASITLSGDTIFYAKWTKVAITVTFNFVDSGYGYPDNGYIVDPYYETDYSVLSDFASKDPYTVTLNFDTTYYLYVLHTYTPSGEYTATLSSNTGFYIYSNSNTYNHPWYGGMGGQRYDIYYINASELVTNSITITF